MGLLDQIAALFKPQAKPKTTSDELAQAAARRTRSVASFGEGMRAETDRANIVKVCREMYKSDPRARGAIKALARDIVQGGFNVQTDDTQAKDIADALIARIALFSRLDDWARLTFRDGDSFLEVGISAQKQIESVTRKPTLSMRRNSNSADLFSDPTKAYWYSDQSFMFSADPPSDAIWFAEWQIVHARWDHDEGERYGVPLFESANGAWKRIKEGEHDIAVRRKVRAGMKLNHQFPPGTPQEDIDTYMEKSKVALDNPFEAVADYFSTAKIEVVQGDANLNQIDDVLHHIDTFGTASPVPLELIGYGRNLNRDVLEEKKKQYDETLDQVKTWCADEIVKPIIEREWLLHGILPASLGYQIVWKSKTKLTPESLAALSTAVMQLRTMGLDDAAILAILTKFLPDIELGKMLLPNLSQQIAGAASGL
ncbi:hypothetical protein ANRL1_03958 [Anaerolineae bacterium]|nr:hypothetical protein ANRL1_03958 [Anaerolineae bacterium]